MTASAFAFTKLVVADLEVSVGFYCDVFGMTRTGAVTSDEHAYALEEAMLSLPGTPGRHTLIITRYTGRPAPPAGAAWTGFVVDDLKTALRAAVKAGGGVEVPIHENAEHGVRAAIVADPDGHLIEIIQTMSA